ncbi:MAG: hypothetical protein QXE70_04265 [Ignisphaera sp.]
MIKLINSELESSRNIFEILNQIKKILLTIVEKEFNNNQKLIEFVIKRVSGARNVITRQSKIYLTDEEIREWIPSSKTVDKPLSRRIKFKTLNNEETYIMTRSSDEDYYYMTSVSRYRMKCTCWDSIYTSSIADKKMFNMTKLLNIDIHQHTVFSRYSICKHTIASISRAIHIGYLDINDNELLNTLRLSLLGAYLRIEEKPDKELVSRLLLKVKRI